MELTFAQKAVEALRQYCQNEYGGSVNAMISALGIEVGNGVVHRWFKGTSTPQLKVIGPFLDKIGAEVVLPGKSETISHRELQTRIEQLQKQLEEAQEERDKAFAAQYLLKGELSAYQGLLEKALGGVFERHQATITQSGEGNHLNALNNN